MGEVDIVRQELNVFRMQLLGAEVRPVVLGEPDPQGRDQRGAARLGGLGRDDALLHRLGGRPASVSPTSCASSNGSSATRRGAVPGDARGARPRHRRRLRRRGLERRRHLRRLRGHDARTRRRRGGGRRGDRRAGSPGIVHGMRVAVPPGRGRARSSRRTRSRPGSTIRASVPSTPSSRRPAARRTSSVERRRGGRRLPAAVRDGGDHPRARAGARRSPGLLRGCGSGEIPAGATVLVDAVGARRQGRRPRPLLARRPCRDGAGGVGCELRPGLHRVNPRSIPPVKSTTEHGETSSA